MKKTNNLYFRSSGTDEKEFCEEISKESIHLFVNKKTSFVLIEKIQRINLNNFYTNSIDLPLKKTSLNLGISNDQEFCFVGEKGIHFFDLKASFKNVNVKRIINKECKTLYIFFLTPINNKIFNQVSSNRQKKLYTFIKIVIIGTCKKVYIKGKGKKFNPIKQSFFNLSLQNKKDFFWFMFWKNKLKSIFKRISNQGVLLDLNSNDEKLFKSIINKNFTIILEVVNKTELLVHGTNEKYVGDYIHKIKKNYPINPYTGEGIHTSIKTIAPTKSGKKM